MAFYMHVLPTVDKCVSYYFDCRYITITADVFAQDCRAFQDIYAFLKFLNF